MPASAAPRRIFRQGQRATSAWSRRLKLSEACRGACVAASRAVVRIGGVVAGAAERWSSAWRARRCSVPAVAPRQCAAATSRSAPLRASRRVEERFSRGMRDRSGNLARRWGACCDRSAPADRKA
eukprot:361871-Chlamydomonas_euryale.AAC.11